MKSENNFLSDLTDLVRMAKETDDELTTAQIKDYFSEFELTDKHYVMIATYLSQKGIVIKDFDLGKLDRVEQEKLRQGNHDHDHKHDHDCQCGHDHAHAEEHEEAPVLMDDVDNEDDLKYLKMYKEELASLKKYSKQEKEELYAALLHGEAVKQKIIEANLRKVVTIASSFEDSQMLLEDLIQEGNIVLMSVVEQMATEYSKEHKVTPENFQTHLNSLVRTGLVNLLDDESMSVSQINTVLAKTNLIYEATKVLAEDLGRVATIKELSEFTKLDEQEIDDVVVLSLKEIQLGKEE